MRAVIVGAGESSRDLIRRLGDNWDVVVVDPDEGRLETILEIRDVEAVVGDGSSAVVLNKAGIASAAVLVAATGSDDVNLEAARLAQRADVEHIVALVRLPSRRGEYQDLGVETIAPALLSARALEIAMEPRKVVSTTFADGKAEAIEFEITPDSPVQGKALKEIHSELWVVAAILREGGLVVPHGSTRLLTGDRVTVVGAAASFSQVVRTFAGGVSRFPLNFGQQVLVALDSPSSGVAEIAEAAHFVRNSNAVGLIIVHREPDSIKSAAIAEVVAESLQTLTTERLDVEVTLRPTSGNLGNATISIASDESVGMIVAPMPQRSFFKPFSAIPSILNRFRPAGVPVLLTKGGTEFNEIIAPARRTISGDTAGRAAIDIARTAGTKVIGVAVANPVFMGGDDLMQKRSATAWLRREASVQDVDVERHVVRGNPVKVLSGATHTDSLLVISMPTTVVSRLRPGIGVWTASRSNGSVLFVPSEA
jgi:Trk K+ transport system NAD-binding subunit